ncbi:MAG TPA: hypothetical protein VNM14_11030, partial [Planctomycetota bacterium]|nr:hypothetical protein [Planctomycetota bacterium]
MNILSALATLILLSQEKSELTAEQLINQLKDESTRSSAYYELSRRAGEKEAKTEAEFRQSHRSPELVVCQQGGQEAPIYVLLSDFLPRRAGRNDLGAGDDKLFKAAGPTSRKKEKLIEAFSAAGKPVKPWGGNNVVTDGLLYDLNGDGLVERADGGGYSLRKSGKSAAVLEVSVVREKAERIFAVVYNFVTWGEWGYDF